MFNDADDNRQFCGKVCERLAERFSHFVSVAAGHFERFK